MPDTARDLKRPTSWSQRLMQLFTAIIVAAFPVAIGGGIVFGLRPALGGVLCCMGAAASLCFAGAALLNFRGVAPTFRRRWRRAAAPDAPFTRTLLAAGALIGLAGIAFSVAFPVAGAGFLIYRAVLFFCGVTDGPAG